MLPSYDNDNIYERFPIRSQGFIYWPFFLWEEGKTAILIEARVQFLGVSFCSRNNICVSIAENKIG